MFWRWREAGVWKRVHDALRERVRKAAGKKRTPTAAIIDSQSIRTAEGGDERGYDGAKKITGRKRHLAVDTLGLILGEQARPAVEFKARSSSEQLSAAAQTDGRTDETS